MRSLLLAVVVGSLACGPIAVVPSTGSGVRPSVRFVSPVPRVATATPGVPVRLRIPSIQVDSPTQVVGLMPDGSVGTPCDPTKPRARCNVNATAWFNGSVRPGEPGSAVIDGHVDWYGPAGATHDVPAVFAQLHRVQVGAVILVVDDRRVARTFVVDRVTQLPYPKQPDDTYSRDGAPALTLITCAGVFVSANTGMSQRLYVHASLK